MSDRLIASIRVEKLFGLYSYVLPVEGTFGSAAILYGDNGIGKSTILKLAFHLLSAAGNRGHRTALRKLKFASIEVTLISGILVSAKRDEIDDPDIVTYRISRGDDIIATWRYTGGRRHETLRFDQDEVIYYFEEDDLGRPVTVRPSNKARRTRLQAKATIDGEGVFLKALREHAPTMFSLNAERRLDSDAVPDPSDEIELRRVMQMDEPKRINDLVVRSREIALSQALGSAARWISRKAVLGTNQGSMNVHTVYLNVLRHLVNSSDEIGTSSITPAEIVDLTRRLELIERRTAELSRYELETRLSTREFRDALVGQSQNVSIAVGLLKPYIESLEGRLEALDSIYKNVERFVAIINGLLNDKQLSFTLSHGFQIKNRLGNELVPANLSSGEQQLLLLFCYVLIGRDEPSVFMIDEPEISLNIKWQRQLIKSLLEITESARIQFIFASHSMELLAQHRDRVVHLVNNQ